MYRPFTDAYKNCEVVIGLVYPVGSDYKMVVSEFADKFGSYGYSIETIQVSSDIIAPLQNPPNSFASEYERIGFLMDAGNAARDRFKDNGILSLGIANLISSKRNSQNNSNPPAPLGKKLFICNSLKNPEEAKRLREIYGEGFYLVAIDEEEDRRVEHLKSKKISKQQAKELIERDRDDKKEKGHGQNTRDTFQLADFFLSINGVVDKLRADVERIVNAIFGHPYLTPTFDEYAMYCAFVASLRSADLSRQVGAVIARKDEILAYGTNDCPKHGGGLYWPTESNHHIVDKDPGRDYKLGYDSNKAEQKALIRDIIEKLSLKNIQEAEEILSKTRIKDITEYGRTVHAEMEALLFCARNNLYTRGATLYTTTFPCHNCAKHIVAAGISKVIYVEPYPKSKAFELHKDSITENKSEENKKVYFKPFIGIGPRKFFDIFSTKLGNGVEISRKDEDGKIVDWSKQEKNVRIRMIPLSYLERELIASDTFIQQRRENAKTTRTKPKGKRKQPRDKGKS